MPYMEGHGKRYYVVIEYSFHRTDPRC
jgi:hypothetical protein